MNKLKGSIAYLSGPMCRVSLDAAMEWRNFLKPKLNKLGVGILDPCDKPCPEASEEEDFRSKIAGYKESSQYDELATTMKEICRIDLRMVDKADFIIAYVDAEHHMCGTYHEIFAALPQRKPVLCMVEQGKQNTPNWLFGVIPHEFFFSSWEELVNYIEQVNLGTQENDKYWRFFDYEKIYATN